MSCKTSIVILTYNQLDYTKLCLESIRAYTPSESYELIVVDNASTDGTREWLQQQQDLKLLLNNDNVGFPKGCNQGIEMSESDTDILLLNNDTIVTEGWLERLQKQLHSIPEIGAVGPITNNAAYYQTVPVPYQTLDEMQAFSGELALKNERAERRLKLIGFCMLIKRKALLETGLLDEQFSPGNYEDDDYSMRLTMSGYQLWLCRNTFIHHFGGTSFGQKPQAYYDLMKRNEKMFEEKWGFNPAYSCYIRHEIISAIQAHPEARIRVLEVGCACGGTLLNIKHLYKNVELHGIELNEHSAKIAATFAQVRADNIEQQMSYDEGYFDYIIFADVLEHLINPWLVVRNMKRYLKPRGQMLVSLPNVMHISILQDLLNGKWEYADAGLLDRTHMRFFTKQQLVEMFNDAGFSQVDLGSSRIPLSIEQQGLLDRLSTLSRLSDFSDQASTYQYIARLRQQDPVQEVDLLTQLLAVQGSSEATVQELAFLVKDDSELFQYAIASLSNYGKAIIPILNSLCDTFIEWNELEKVIPLLQQALLLDPEHQLTIFNLGAFLYHLGEHRLALTYLNQLKHRDEAIESLIQDAEQRLIVG
ncbi:methyltransferase domain-containing protein [Paenibacillus pasadenensis]|uniref:Glycosyltransferase n=1 Tax=Paenibacillus pasadenensis TaxID=217090 RepID=A0A2N5NDL2_9BACL|nr:glycosyltransferase [Paenibacillus pasadenensis]PLT48437.1 Glycosyltransferase [Paenibacillus pasadenensis]